jgi:hypothetical protein
MAEHGNLKILNVTKDLVAATESTYVFTVPSGGDGEIREATHHLLRSAALTDPGEGGSELTSEAIKVKSFEIVKKGASERTNLLSGSPNIKEFAGIGMLTRLFTVIETSENNEEINILVRNDDTVTVKVSLTLVLMVKTKRREIAAQPASRENPMDRRE